MNTLMADDKRQKTGSMRQVSTWVSGIQESVQVGKDETRQWIAGCEGIYGVH